MGKEHFSVLGEQVIQGIFYVGPWSVCPYAAKQALEAYYEILVDIWKDAELLAR